MLVCKVWQMNKNHFPKLITIDTSILMRIFVADDEIQYEKSMNLLEGVDKFFVPITVFIEVVWVLTQTYKLPKSDVFEVLLDFIENSEKLVCDTKMVRTGLQMLQNNGDFADMINAYIGNEYGYSHFVTFDKKASQKLNQLGYTSILLR